MTPIRLDQAINDMNTFNRKEDITPSAPAPLLGADMIRAERERQIGGEGWSLEHDDAHENRELLYAANCYAFMASGQSRTDVHMRYAPPSGWPWEKEWWKPSEDPIRNLVKAGALIAAEIDRLERQKAKAPNAAGEATASDTHR